MKKKLASRRKFLAASAESAMAGITLALANPAKAAAQAVGVKSGDLPDLTIKEVKVYVLGAGSVSLVELCRAIDTPIHIGEFIFSIYDYAAYIRAGALDVVRLIVDNIGGITGRIKVAHLAECFGMECAPHN